MFRQRQFLPLMGPEERGFQRIQRGSDKLESLINGLLAGEGSCPAVSGGGEEKEPPLPSHQHQAPPCTTTKPSSFLAFAGGVPKMLDSTPN